MEVLLSGAAAPFGAPTSHATCSFLVTGTFEETSRIRLLTGLNLIRPLGPPLGGLPGQTVVRSVTSTLGRLSWRDPGLEIPGADVVPVVTIEPKTGFVNGDRVIELLVDEDGVRVGPDSPAPADVPHVPMSQAASERRDAGWRLNDPTLLSCPIPAYRQTVGGGVRRLTEGALAIFTDVNEIGIVVDVETIPGGGSRATAITIQDFFAAPAVLDLLR